MAIDVGELQRVPGGVVYRVTNLHPDEPGGHLVYVPLEAIAERQERLGPGTTRRQALREIVREHHLRLRGGAEPGAITLPMAVP